MKKQKPKLFIGTSGWYYEHWDNIFYPQKIKKEERLNFYTNSFNTVEINNTFYRIPNEETIVKWYNSVPSDFFFAVKANRYITHIKHLNDPWSTTQKFFSVVNHLKEKLGPILFQLPPSYKKNASALENFIDSLPKEGYRYTFEFRHPSWYDDDIYRILTKFSIALCITDLKGKTSPEKITTNFSYVRLHGPKASSYRGEYGAELLSEWKKRIDKWKNEDKMDVYCYFDNDEKSYATKDAIRLKEMLERE